jgi:hypothetical protein
MIIFPLKIPPPLSLNLAFIYRELDAYGPMSSGVNLG